MSPFATIVLSAWIERRIIEANVDLLLQLGKLTSTEHQTIIGTPQIPE
jgi:hypothetical protein